MEKNPQGVIGFLLIFAVKNRIFINIYYKKGSI
jgi:hypothetical protein